MGSAALASVSPLLGATVSSGPQAAGTPASGFVLRDATVVTMDPKIGDLPRADIHVRDGQIVQVGPSLNVAGSESIDARGMIAMPGFVETHWHLWNSLMRNMLRPGVEYFGLKAALIDHHTVEDFYQANRLALAEALNAGFTTVHNFAHNVRSPAHVDAELRALQEVGLRGRYSYGYIDPMPAEKLMPTDDVVRVRDEWFGSRSPFAGKVDLGIALRGPKFSAPGVFAEEMRAAQRLGLPTVLHIGQSQRFRVPVAELAREGLLDSKTLLVHGVVATAEDREAMNRIGMSLSVSPQSELRLQADGDFRDQLLQARAAGINQCMSIDATSLGSVSMFDAMHTVWNLGVPWRGTASEKLKPLDFEYCLQMATSNGAAALGLADQVGSLSPGKRADLILIRSGDLNIAPLGEVRTALVRSATVANVDSVIIDGVFRKRGGRLIGIDVEKVVQEATQALDGIRRRAGGVWAPS